MEEADRVQQIGLNVSSGTGSPELSQTQSRDP